MEFPSPKVLNTDKHSSYDNAIARLNKKAASEVCRASISKVSK